MNVIELLLTNAVSASVLAVLVFGITRFVKQPPLVYGLWLVVVLKLATPPIVEIPIVTEVIDRPDRVLTTIYLDEDGRPVVPDAPAVESRVVLVRATNFEAGPVMAGAPLTEIEDSEAHLVATEEAAPAGWKLPSLGLTLAAVWIAGAALFLVLLFRRTWRFRRVVRRAPLAPSWVRERARALAEAFELSTPEVRVVARAVPPLLWPFGRSSTIVLPDGLVDRLDDNQLDTLLAHELAHLRRRDHWVRILEIGLLAAYWWFPVLRWVLGHLREAEEQCCDAWVVWRFPERAGDYAETLLATIDFLSETKIHETRKNAPPTTLPAALPWRGHRRSTTPTSCEPLKRRFEMILNRRFARRLSPSAKIAMWCTAALVLPLAPLAVSAESGGKDKIVIVKADGTQHEFEVSGNAGDEIQDAIEKVIRREGGSRTTTKTGAVSSTVDTTVRSTSSPKGWTGGSGAADSAPKVQVMIDGRIVELESGGSGPTARLLKRSTSPDGAIKIEFEADGDTEARVLRTAPRSSAGGGSTSGAPHGHASAADDLIQVVVNGEIIELNRDGTPAAGAGRKGAVFPGARAVSPTTGRIVLDVEECEEVTGSSPKVEGRIKLMIDGKVHELELPKGLSGDRMAFDLLDMGDCEDIEVELNALDSGLIGKLLGGDGSGTQSGIIAKVLGDCEDIEIDLNALDSGSIGKLLGGGGSGVSSGIIAKLLEGDLGAVDLGSGTIDIETVIVDEDGRVVSESSNSKSFGLGGSGKGTAPGVGRVIIGGAGGPSPAPKKSAGLSGFVIEDMDIDGMIPGLEEVIRQAVEQAIQGAPDAPNTDAIESSVREAIEKAMQQKGFGGGSAADRTGRFVFPGGKEGNVQLRMAPGGVTLGGSVQVAPTPKRPLGFGDSAAPKGQIRIGGGSIGFGGSTGSAPASKSKSDRIEELRKAIEDIKPAIDQIQRAIDELEKQKGDNRRSSSLPMLQDLPLVRNAFEAPIVKDVPIVREAATPTAPTLRDVPVVQPTPAPSAPASKSTTVPLLKELPLIGETLAPSKGRKGR
ncbi:MAG: M56 family metallopeptidase [Planctomycetota bacterium]